MHSNKNIINLRLLSCFSILGLIILTFSCDDSNYPLDNWVDVPLQTMKSPAVFFNPHEISTNQNGEQLSVGDTFAINLYALEVENVAGIHFRVEYLRQSLELIDIISGELFVDAYDTLFFWSDSSGSGFFDVYSFYLATDEYTYSNGTASLATAIFRTKNSVDSELIYDRIKTKMVSPDNIPINIKTYGKAVISVE